MAKRKMDATLSPTAPTSLGGQEVDGEATAGSVGSTYRGVLVERANKAATRNQMSGRTPLLDQSMPAVTQTSRKTGRVG